MLPHDLDRYRAALLSTDLHERRAIARAIAERAATQHADFLRLCYQLLDDPNLRVRDDILFHLKRFGDRDDTLAETKVLAALAVPQLRPRALLALGTVGTASIFPLLYDCAVAGEMFALNALARQSRSEMQRQQAKALGRTWLLSEVYNQREEALQALRILSTAGAEEDLLLDAYLKYGDELVVWALGGASARMLPILHRLLKRWPVGCAEYGDVMKAIRRLETRIAYGESADPADAQGMPYLGDFL